MPMAQGLVVLHGNLGGVMVYVMGLIYLDLGMPNRSRHLLTQAGERKKSHRHRCQWTPHTL